MAEFQPTKAPECHGREDCAGLDHIALHWIALLLFFSFGQLGTMDDDNDDEEPNIAGKTIGGDDDDDDDDEDQDIDDNGDGDDEEMKVRKYKHAQELANRRAEAEKGEVRMRHTRKQTPYGLGLIESFRSSFFLCLCLRVCVCVCVCVCVYVCVLARGSAPQPPGGLSRRNRHSDHHSRARPLSQVPRPQVVSIDSLGPKGEPAAGLWADIRAVQLSKHCQAGKSAPQGQGGEVRAGSIRLDST